MSDPEKESDGPLPEKSKVTPLATHAQTLPVLDSKDLFQGAREVIIDHQGSLYRLRLTRTGKLILHK